MSAEESGSDILIKIISAIRANQDETFQLLYSKYKSKIGHSSALLEIIKNIYMFGTMSMLKSITEKPHTALDRDRPTWKGIDFSIASGNVRIIKEFLSTPAMHDKRIEGAEFFINVYEQNKDIYNKSTYLEMASLLFDKDHAIQTSKQPALQPQIEVSSEWSATIINQNNASLSQSK